MKKVLFICSLYHPHIGGIETMTTELARFYRKHGIESIVLTKKWPNGLSERDEYDNIKIFRVVSARTGTEFDDLIRWVKVNEKEIKADIIGVRRPLPLIGFLLSRYWNVPNVLTVAGGEIPNLGDPETQRVWEEGKELMKPVLENSDVVTCVSRSLEKELQRVVPDLISVRTIYAGIDVAFINSVVCTETECDYIVSLRRLIPSKGINTLLKAFNDIAVGYHNLKLLIAGSGSEEVTLKQLANSLDLDDRVKFIGSVPFLRAISLLKGAICTVVPSISEGGGLINIEAQASACPVIASRVGGIPEYVKDGESGLLFKPGDIEDLTEKIKRVVGDASLRDKLIRGGLEYSSKFSWDILAPQYLALYKELLIAERDYMFEPWSDLTCKLWLRLTQ